MECWHWHRDVCSQGAHHVGQRDDLRSEDELLTIAEGDAEATLRVWRLSSIPELYGVTSKVKSQHTVELSWENRHIRLNFDDADVELLSFSMNDSGDEPTASTLSHDRKLVAVAFAKEILLWNCDTAKAESILKSHLESVTRLAFSPDNSKLFCTNRKNKAEVWKQTEQSDSAQS